MQMTSKELSYLSDSMKNEDLLTKLCVQAGIDCQNAQLGTFFTHMAEARFDQHNRLLGTLEQTAGAPHYPNQ